jgi:hypothetical protein
MEKQAYSYARNRGWKIACGFTMYHGKKVRMIWRISPFQDAFSQKVITGDPINLAPVATVATASPDDKLLIDACQKIENVIQHHAVKNPISKSFLIRLTRNISTTTRNRALDILIQTRRIDDFQDGEGRKKSTLYKIAPNL